jgi:dolichol-phosphate mannosyltransferase
VPRVSVVVPVRNEAGNVVPLLDEIERACATFGSFEVLYVDDGSADATAAELAQARATRPWLRVIRHAESCGQSAAVRTGVRAARASIVATLDGDGQNDPAFIPELVSALDRAGPGIGLVAGQRLRRVGGYKKLQSRIANAVRGAVLNDGTRDTGCGLKAFRRGSTPCTGSCRLSSSGRGSGSRTSMSSTGRGSPGSRTTACSTGSGSASSTLPGCGG